MIAHLRGKLISKHPNQAIVEAAGVGYDVTITVPTFSDLPPQGSEVALHIHTHVREDALQLFGGYGYLKDFPAERHVRDLRVHQILEGTNEIMRVIVSREMFRQ